MVALYDMHCHLGFASDDQSSALFSDEEAAGGFLSATVTPGEYQELLSREDISPKVRVALGIHPHWVSQGICDGDALDKFLQFAPDVPIISEVGLDSRKKWVGQKESQLRVFRQVLEACRGGQKLLSVHTSEAEMETMDLMEEYGTFRDNRCIFHWYSGSCEGLHRAIKLGSYFSCGRKMTVSKRGREYLKVIPADRLLLETDFPREAGDAYSLEEHLAALQEILTAIEDIRGERLGDRIAGNSGELLESVAR